MSNPYRDRLLSIGVITRRPDRRVREYRDDNDNHRIRETTDEFGNTVTEHATKDDRQDVLVRPKVVTLKPTMMT